jgi:hypothetical protein
MKDHLLQTVAGLAPDRRLHPAREYLQLYMLRLLHAAGAYQHFAFVGGTALRVLHDLPRFSEDLDFSATPARAPGAGQAAEPARAPGSGQAAELARAPGAGQAAEFDPGGLWKRLAGDLDKAGYDVRVRQRADRAVAGAFFRFQGLPRELGWSRDPRLGLLIKVEIDRAPPAGAVVETTLIQRLFPIALRHYDLPSLFAGKLHAILCRPYAKGRDWFDLAWYLTARRGVEPNLVLLDNALRQTGTRVHASDWRQAVNERLRALKWNEVTADLRGFLQRPDDLDHLRPELIAKALGC